MINEIDEMYTYIYIIAFYILIGLHVARLAKIEARNYILDTRNKIVSITLYEFISKHVNYLGFLGGSLFPLYWCFKLGMSFGNNIYDILTDNKYENRIASWVV